MEQRYALKQFFLVKCIDRFLVSIIMPKMTMTIHIFNFLPKKPAMITVAILLLSACTPGVSRFGGEGKPPTLDVAAMGATAQPQEAGNPLYCRIGKGEARFARGWYEFSDVTFTLRQGTKTRADLRAVTDGSNASLVGMFAADGQKMIFCPLRDGQPGARVSCASVYALEDDLNDGIKRTFDVPEAVRGAAISCALSPQHLRPLATPLSGGN